MTQPLRINVYRFPARVAIAMDVAPLVRRNVVTDLEGRELVERRYQMALLKMRADDEARPG